VALEAALAELQAWSHHEELAERLAELRDERGAVGAAANSALQGGLDAEQAADVTRVVQRLEAALAARVAGGLD
jgi:flagellar biosynthesis chaperone FliJ